MDSKLNYEAIDKYSAAFTKVLLDKHFTGHSHITGEQILVLSSMRQINLFIIKLLFEQWQNEIDKFKSPYFDYEVEEVKSAIENFQNTLSRHISIDRQHLEALMAKAVRNTLLLVLSPYHFYYNELNIEDDDMVDVKKLKSSEKFIKINTAIYHTLIQKFEKVSKDSISHETATDLLNHVLEETEVIPEDASEYVVKFNEVVLLDIQKIYLEEEQVKVSEVEEAQPRSTMVDTSQEPEPVTEPEQLPIVEPMLTVQEETETPADEPDDSTPVQEEEQEISIVGENEAEDELPNTVVTLNDTYQQEGQQSIADIHEAQNITSIENTVTLNQRFMFVNTLFNGEIDQFNKTINKLDEMDSMADAKEYLDRHFQGWDYDDDEVREFMEIVSRRFG